MDKPQRFAPRLLQPFLDLAPVTRGPLYARAISFYWQAFVHEDGQAFALQRTLPSAFRAQVQRDAGHAQPAADDPRSLPAQDRSERWRSLCEALDRWEQLAPHRRTRLALLLHGLCCYAPLPTLLGTVDCQRLRKDAAYAELVYWRESARYMLGLQGPVALYTGADLSLFEHLATAAPVGTPAGFNAAVKVFAHRSKTGATVPELQQYAGWMERTLAAANAEASAFDAGLRTSRYYRALAFLPMRAGDSAGMVHMMDLAEQHARALQPGFEAEQLLFLENLHPVMESRAKEALWLGDTALALTRAQAVVDLDPYDPKSWVELGQLRMKREEWTLAAEAYATAGLLGPPAAAMGRHMAGICLREAGQPALAAFFFKEALEADPLGISPREALQHLPAAPLADALGQWALDTFRL